MNIWLNEYEIEDVARRFDPPTLPNLATAAHTLQRLVWWTNENSDGWPYWQKPARAANRLMLLVHDRDAFGPDVSDAELKKALTPIKAFLTRYGVEHSEVL